ncbi:4-alpha-glucanotransferase [Mobilisporobacter senegalensis]|uniref:4-alpha-glucanotransferase n=1 Tax=Mobilisporobacter senegalensis TaxID=1329262 RepID=A0A3N1XWM8_9FIRM|nr:4-alpha-glucanotransferase [Mobilisporobacter senegalensis]ROR29347.1 4-alpha-glucanotransferase [Mobilisporobacter senegalensis]
MRASGILLPIASLPSNYGIGCFSKSAYEFINILKKAGQKYWQILPIGPTGYGDSPYQSFSTFAGNPYFIDLDALIEEGMLCKDECDSYDVGNNARYIDYEKIYLSRFKLLRIAYERSNIGNKKEFKEFNERNAYWLDDYALYMAVKNQFDGVSWNKWDEDIKLRKPDALVKYKKELSNEVEFYKYIQYVFSNQWEKLKKYANEKGIQIIGDIPIYVAFDSADTWSNPELFQLDEFNNPIAVAGCPPDAFSDTGQLWGNPLYRWDYHKKNGFGWWFKRIEYCFELYDVLRVDHFKGFDEYYSIPFGDTTAEFGHWEKGPGIEFFEAMKKQLGDINLIAEDLGNLTDSVRLLLKQTGYPGMKVLEFAFDSREESDYLPHNYDKNSIVYTGTHDNDTIHGWYEKLCKEDKELAKAYLNNYNNDINEVHWDFIRLAQQSVSKLCIIPIQDYLGLGSNARINTPSTVGDNWKWRLVDGDISEELTKKIYKIMKLYGRL